MIYNSDNGNEEPLMNFEQLLYAEVLAQYQSMQKAAQALHISKPGLSHAIHQLEDELGIQLFIKNAKGTFITPEGQHLLANMNEILRTKNKLIANANQLAKPTQRKYLKIEYMNTMLRAFIEPFIQHYTKKYAQLTLDISCHEISSIIQHLQEEKCDAAFIATNQLEESELAPLHFLPVLDSKLVLLCAKNNPLLDLNRKISTDDLKHQNFCLFNDQFHEDIFHQLQFHCGPLNLILRVDDSWAMEQAITHLNAVCFCRLNQSKLAEDSHLIHLESIDIGHIINDQFKLGWLINPKHEITPEGQSFIQKVTEKLQNSTNLSPQK